jgi:thiamine pyrophosphate-dependent acetolactate synthase large subunit-like protein
VSTPASFTDRDVVHAILAARTDRDLIVGSPGYASAHLADAGPDDPTTLPQMELGYATPVALGLALTQPDRQVIAIDGDGSLSAKLSVLADVAHIAPPNLTIVVINNRRYGSFTMSGAGVQPTATAWGLDFAAVARGAGLDYVREAHDVVTLRAQLAAALRTPATALLVAHTPDVVPPLNAEPYRSSVLVTQAMHRELTRPSVATGPTPGRG